MFGALPPPHPTPPPPHTCLPHSLFVQITLHGGPMVPVNVPIDGAPGILLRFVPDSRASGREETHIITVRVNNVVFAVRHKVFTEPIADVLVTSGGTTSVEIAGSAGAVMKVNARSVTPVQVRCSGCRGMQGACFCEAGGDCLC